MKTNAGVVARPTVYFLLMLILSGVFEICGCGFTVDLLLSFYFVLASPVISKHD